MTASWMNGPVPEQDAVIARLRESNAILREELQQATLKPYRSFLRGMVVGGFIVAALIASLPAYAESISIGTTHVNRAEGSTHTTVTIEAATEPGQIAIVTFSNEAVNSGNDNGTYVLALGDVLTVEARFTWEAIPILGSDRIDLTVPAGVTCEPADCGVTVMEGRVGTIVLFEYLGG